jgi:ubiquinol-cytochrome c reductase cytochrome c subunit
MTEPTASRSAEETPGRTGWPGRLARLRRRASGTVVLGLALGVVGIGYAAVAPSSDAGEPSADVVKGQQTYRSACISCHGANLQGVQGRGPSLLGVGEAAVYFQVATGRMPASGQGAQEPRKGPGLRPSREAGGKGQPPGPPYTEDEVNQIAAYVQSVGGGPQLPADVRDRDTENLGEGGELFRLNCAQCHNFAGRGGALSSGKHAPGLGNSTDQVIYAAMLTGPENMPVFGDNQITPEQKRAIVNYVQTLKETKDPGGHGLGRLGPVPEGIVIWVVGIGSLMFMVLWIGAKS